MSQLEPSLKQLDSIQIQSPTKHKDIESKKMTKSEHKPSTPFAFQPIKHEKKQSEIPAHLHSHSLYEQTYYLTGLRQNYLVLISDNMHIIELPVGLMKANVAIGDPIKLKLEFDTKRAQADQRKFISVQENLIKELSEE